MPPTRHPTATQGQTRWSLEGEVGLGDSTSTGVGVDQQDPRQRRGLH